MWPGALRGLGVAAGLGVLSCAPPAERWRAPGPATFKKLVGLLDAQRRERPASPWAAGIHVVMREPRTGRIVEGRGAMAVAPGRAVRMVLLGGAGSTMLDVWVSQARWRVSAPPLEVLRRGTTDPDDLPVGFLRWWFTEPLGGTLFAAEERPAGPSWLLRNGDAIVHLTMEACPRGRGLLAERRSAKADERVSECRASASTTVGDFAHYESLQTGLRVDVSIESVASSPPEDAAFVEPDDAGVGEHHE